MHDTLCREIVERLAVAGAGTRRIPALDRGWMWWRVGQGLGGEQIAATARPARVPPAPDLGRPVGRASRSTDHGLRGYHHRRADRLKAEFLLTPPPHADRLTGLVKADDCRVGGSIIGAVVAIAARALHMLDRDYRRIELQGTRQSIAQRVDPL